VIETLNSPYELPRDLVQPHRVGPRIKPCLFRLLQVSVFQCAFMASVLNPPAKQGFEFTIRTFRRLIDQLQEQPEAGLVTFFVGPAVLYLVVRSLTLERFFEESWLRFSCIGAVTFHVLFIIGSPMLRFANDQFGEADWALRVTRGLAVLGAVFIALLFELVFAKAMSLVWMRTRRTEAVEARRIA